MSLYSVKRVLVFEVCLIVEGQQGMKHESFISGVKICFDAI